MRYKQLLHLFLLGIFLLIPSSYAKELTDAHHPVNHTIIHTVDGKSIDVDLIQKGLHFKGLEDKIVLLEFFGHSCPPCRASIPGYNKLQKKYPDDVVVIAIESWGMNKEKLKHYVKERNMVYEVVPTTDAGKVFKFVKELTGWSPNYGVPYLMLFAPGGALSKTLPPQRLNESYVESLIEEIRKKQ